MGTGTERYVGHSIGMDMDPMTMYKRAFFRAAVIWVQLYVFVGMACRNNKFGEARTIRV